MRAFISLLVLILATQAACRQSIRQKDFVTPQSAVHALVAAVQAEDMRTLLEVVGPEAETVVMSGDPVQDKNSRERFLASYSQGRALADNDDGSFTLEVGSDQWPFPFPIVKRNDRYRFDSAAGAEEIVNRRIGANELATIQSCLAFVDAQREYYVRNPEQDALLHYAHKLISSDGLKDGLYWPASASEVPSPLGEAFARARSEGYLAGNVTEATPFHGYLYRLLNKQGPHAAGGSYDYVVQDEMLGGFALIAFPAEYGSSGVMTFIVNHDGIVYSKDLGTDTAAAAQSIQSFDPDPSWSRERVADDASIR